MRPADADEMCRIDKTEVPPPYLMMHRPSRARRDDPAVPIKNLRVRDCQGVLAKQI
jgi:hypothetical protein